MQNIERRIAALEATTALANEFTIIRRFVRPGHLDAEVFHLRDDDGKLWTRQTGESEQELIDRATLEVRRTPWGVGYLMTDDVETPHADH